MERGILKVFPEAEIISLPMADGGEGTVETLVNVTKGEFVTVPVTDPLGNQVKAVYGMLGSTKTAIIEMAAASGLTLVPEKKQNPFHTTTYGTGELIRHALDNGCKRIIVGIGGSATIDGGAGMLQALGTEFFDELGKPMLDFMTNKKIGRVSDFSLENFHQAIRNTKFTIACDVENPLLGPAGAAYIFGRQKGAQSADLPQLEENLERFYNVAESKLNQQVRDSAGAGAAGGLGAALLAFFNAKMEKGIDIVLETVNFRDKISGASLIFTGEGRIDEQTVMGKTISGILKIAGKQKTPVIALAGSVSGELDELYTMGLTAAFSICNEPMTVEHAFKKAADLIENRAEQICRLYKNLRN